MAQPHPKMYLVPPPWVGVQGWCQGEQRHLFPCGWKQGDRNPGVKVMGIKSTEGGRRDGGMQDSQGGG